jgi:hypothetical protein
MQPPEGEMSMKLYLAATTVVFVIAIAALEFVGSAHADVLTDIPADMDIAIPQAFESR